MYQVQLVVTIVCETEPIYRETGWSDFNLSHISCLLFKTVRCSILWKLPVGDGTSVEEKDADEDGGEGGEVPQVQDGADQGHAPQLPVVAGDWASFHSISITKCLLLHSGENSPQVWGAEEVFDCKDGQVGEGEEARQRSCKGCRVVLKKFEKSNKELSCKNKLEEKTQWRKGLSCKKICWFENIECLGTLRPAQQTYVAADLIVTLRHMTIVIFAVWALFYIAAVLWRQFWTNKIKVELGRPVFKRGEIYIYMYLLWEYGRGTI